MQGEHLYVGNIGFHGQPPSGAAVNFEGFMYVRGGLQGVRGGVGVTAAAVQRPGRHGEYDLPVFKQARIVTIDPGWAFAKNAGALEQLGIVLGGLGGDGQSMPLTYYSPGGMVLTGRGRVILQDFQQEVGGIHRARYSLSLRMPDPRWYGETHESDSVNGVFVDSVNRGNVPAHPRFEVTAGAAGLPSGYSLVGRGGRAFGVPVALAAGKKAEIDFRTGTVRHDGVRVQGVTPRTWTVDGGGVIGWQLVPVSGAGTAKCFVTAPIM